MTPGRAGALPGTVVRMLRVGFEVRLTVEPDHGPAWHEPGSELVPGTGPEPVSVVLSRTHARSLDLELGSRVWLTPAVGAATVPVMVAV